MCQQYIALAGTKDKIAVPLRRKVKNVRKKRIWTLCLRKIRTGYNVGKDCIGCKLCYSAFCFLLKQFRNNF